MGRSAEKFGIVGGARITVHVRLLGELAFQCWTCPQRKNGQVLACTYVVLSVWVSTASGLSGWSRAILGGLSTLSNEHVFVSATFREPRRRAQGGQGGQVGGAGGGPRQPRNLRDTVFSLQQQALEALKDLLGPEITAQLRATLSQKMDPPKSVEEKLAEKKRELGKKRAHLATLDAQHTQMLDKQREHAERLLRHTAVVRECAEQVEILESEFAQLKNEVQVGSSNLLVEEEDSEDEMDSAEKPLPPDVGDLSEPQDVAKRRKTVGGHMDVDSMVFSPALVESASAAAEAIDVVQLRKLQVSAG